MKEGYIMNQPDKSIYYKGEKLVTIVMGSINSGGGLCYYATIEGVEVTRRFAGSNYVSGWRETTPHNTEIGLRYAIRSNVELK